MEPRSDARYTLETRVGRLIEARVFHLEHRADADEYSQALGREVAAHPAHVRPVLCADHRPVRVYPPEATERLVELFQQMNKRLARIAILVSSSNATLLLQLERLVREAGYEHRRVFRETEPAVQHLGVELSEAELARAREFLGEHG